MIRSIGSSIVTFAAVVFGPSAAQAEIKKTSSIKPCQMVSFLRSSPRSRQGVSSKCLSAGTLSQHSRP